MQLKVTKFSVIAWSSIFDISINWHQLLLINIDYHRLLVSLIDHAEYIEKHQNTAT